MEVSVMPTIIMSVRKTAFRLPKFDISAFRTTLDCKGKEVVGLLYERATMLMFWLRYVLNQEMVR